MRLYHGSYCKITKVDLSYSEPHKDFGRGFYLTDDFSNAVLVANWKQRIKQSPTAEITPFIFNRQICPESLKIKDLSKNRIEWIKFIIANRDHNINFKHDYDIVIGPVADDNVNKIIEEFKDSFPDNFNTDEVLLELANRLLYKRNYTQYCFCTEEALKYLIYE